MHKLWCGYFQVLAMLWVLVQACLHDRSIEAHDSSPTKLKIRTTLAGSSISGVLQENGFRDT